MARRSLDPASRPFLGPLLLLAALVVAGDDKKVRVVLVGDSTVTDNAGWGAGFARRLAPDAECINMARGGQSSKSYLDQGLWTKALALKLDFVLIQFGHNDQPGKGPRRETDPATRDYLMAQLLERTVVPAVRPGSA